MKHVPEIAPEIRGLMEEIVADPRSRMRIAPRRALREWFDTDETIRPREVSGTSAERHLLAVHREALADLLREAAKIAYWKAPVLTRRPLGVDGKTYDPVDLEPEWRERARVHARLAPARDAAVTLLAGCLNGLHASQAHDLAIASLSLVAHHRTRAYVGLTVSRRQPRASLAVFGRIIERKPPRWLANEIRLSIGARFCDLGLLADARDSYLRVDEGGAAGVAGCICAFNLSCFIGDRNMAVRDAQELGRRVPMENEVLLAERDLLKEWAATRAPDDLKRAKSVFASISAEVPAAAAVVAEAFTS